MDSQINTVSPARTVSAAVLPEAFPGQTSGAARTSAAPAAQSSTTEPRGSSAPKGAAHLLGGNDSSADTLKVSVDDKGAVIVRIVDSSGEVVRQVPPEELVALAKRLDEAIGLLFDKKA